MPVFASLSSQTSEHLGALGAKALKKCYYIQKQKGRTTKMIKKVSLLILVVINCIILIGCVTVSTRTNTANTNAPLKGKFTIKYQVTDAQQNLFAKMISVKLKKIGLTESKEDADYFFNVTASVVPKGNRRHGMANQIGSNMAMVNVSVTPLYSKSLSITVNDKNQRLVWTGNTLEDETECGLLGATMPELITAIFENYPSDLMNKKHDFYLGNSETGEIKNHFPDMDWSCY
ncbi:DUF4136 domain-containing protein [Leptospira haakeii]|uniref:DUF4136 domain-containing protein n=1 Tax=Leptospira haakeii TaxID=2023198 RepID=A0ABX4PHH5_9LEPT|nr:DUF4136 domain-containing protein [Leptospira haakeii]PKA14336.1 hypothetical protein CH363_19250 [Leptospira haakeii]PKA18194.1 hypothetical protein CH377_19005 [Leptospira haakeii]